MSNPVQRSIRLATFLAVLATGLGFVVIFCLIIALCAVIFR